MAEIMIVTGGSRGIGAAVARLAGQRGYDVCVNYARAKDRAEEVVKDIEKAGRRAIAVQADVGVEDDLTRLFETVDKELGAVTALVNNAGVDYDTQIAEFELSGLERVYAVNIFALFISAREAIKRMSSERGANGGPSLTSVRFRRVTADYRATSSMRRPKVRSMRSPWVSRASWAVRGSGSPVYARPDTHGYVR